jgi:hypothetical protein
MLDVSVTLGETCCRSASLSVSERKLAVEGSSGSQKKVDTPRSTVTPPKTTNMMRQLSNLEVVTCWKPKDRKPPII